MRVDVCVIYSKTIGCITDKQQDPTVQKATGKTSPVDVMAALREMKNKS